MGLLQKLHKQLEKVGRIHQIMKIHRKAHRKVITLVVFFVIFGLLVSACDVIETVVGVFPGADATEMKADNGDTQNDEFPLPTLAPTQVPIDHDVITVWVQPQFDPEDGSPQADILKSHIQAYIDQNPGVKIRFRLKSADGATSLINSLSITAQAAPRTVCL